MVINPNSFFFKWYLGGKYMSDWPRTVCGLLTRFTWVTIIYTLLLNVVVRVGHSLIMNGDLSALVVNSSDSIFTVISICSTLFILYIGLMMLLIITCFATVIGIAFILFIFISNFHKVVPTVMKDMTIGLYDRVKNKACNLITYKS